MFQTNVLDTAEKKNNPNKKQRGEAAWQGGTIPHKTRLSDRRPEGTCAAARTEVQVDTKQKFR